MNKVTLIGNITQDLELKETGNGKKVINFSLATNKRVKIGDNYENKGEFHSLVAWNKTAELISQYLSKGSKVAIIGELQTRSWEGDDGVKKYKTEILVNEIEFLSSSNKEKVEDLPEKTVKKTPKRQEEVTVEDIPF